MAKSISVSMNNSHPENGEIILTPLMAGKVEFEATV